VLVSLLETLVHSYPPQFASADPLTGTLLSLFSVLAHMRAFLFDLDETLHYTKPEYLQHVFTQAFAAFDKPSPTAEQMQRLWFGIGRTELLNELGLDLQDYWCMHNSFDPIYRRLENTIVYDDARATISALHARGFLLGVMTNAHTEFMAAALERFDGYFRSQVSGDLTRGLVRPKPSPDGILCCLDELGVRPSDAAYVGNATEDIIAARGAGVLDVHIRRSGVPEPLVTPSVQIDSLQELLMLYR
jgi:phosphoglycolate phosphatase-like HAD superfamily hydrolase